MPPKSPPKGKGKSPKNKQTEHDRARRKRQQEIIDGHIDMMGMGNEDEESLAKLQNNVSFSLHLIHSVQKNFNERVDELEDAVRRIQKDNNQLTKENKSVKEQLEITSHNLCQVGTTLRRLVLLIRLIRPTSSALSDDETFFSLEDIVNYLFANIQELNEGEYMTNAGTFEGTNPHPLSQSKHTTDRMPPPQIKRWKK
jgi:hypothetical protein